jgi:hypothetical protein
MLVPFCRDETNPLHSWKSETKSSYMGRNSPAVLVESLAFELIFVFDGSTLRVDVVTMFLYPFGRDSSSDCTS